MIWFFVVYIFLPVFFFVIIYKATEYSENWWHRGFKDFLLTSAKDSLLTIVFVVTYCIFSKFMRSRINHSIINELEKIGSFKPYLEPNYDNTNTSKYCVRCGTDDVTSYKCPVMIFDGPGWDKDFASAVALETEQSLNTIMAQNRLLYQNNDGIVFKKIIPKFFKALKFDLAVWDLFEEYWRFSFSVPIRDEDVILMIYIGNITARYPKLEIAKVFFLNAIFGRASLHWQASRSSGLGGMQKLYSNFKARHGLHENESINIWIRGLVRSQSNEHIFKDWENLQDQAQAAIHSEEHQSKKFADISFYIETWSKNLLDWHR